jgi:20S proteasome alpha/beta subunit
VYISKTLQGDTYTLDPKIEKDWEGRKIYMKNSLILQKVNGETLPEVESIAYRLQDIIKNTYIYIAGYHGLMAGVDKDGPKLLEIDEAGCVTSAPYASTGSGSAHILPRLKDKYKANMQREDAIELAMELGLKAAAEDSFVNSNFQVAYIEKTKNGIVARKLTADETNRIKEKVKATLNK